MVRSIGGRLSRSSYEVAERQWSEGLSLLNFKIDNKHKDAMIDYYEIKSQPITIGTSTKFYTFVIEQEEPCEARVSSTVPWEREGAIPSRDPIM